MASRQAVDEWAGLNGEISNDEYITSLEASNIQLTRDLQSSESARRLAVATDDVVDPKQRQKERDAAKRRAETTRAGRAKRVQRPAPDSRGAAPSLRQQRDERELLEKLEGT